MEALSKEKGLEVKTSGFFKRNEGIGAIGYQPEIAAATFGLSRENPLPENPIRSSSGFYVFHFLERREPEGRIDQTQMDQTRTQLLELKRRQLFDDWMAAAKGRTDIQIDRSVLE